MAGILLPEAVAYAGIAGLEAGHALVAAFIGCLVYALIGRCRFAIVAPTSSSAAILAAAVGTFGAAGLDPETAIPLIIASTGLIFLAAVALGLGGLTSFIARPVLRGFAFGLGITIILRQLPALAGLAGDHHSVFVLLPWLIANIHAVHGASLAIGIAALAALFALRRFPALPGAILVLAGSIALSITFDLASRGVAVLGPVALEPLPRSFRWPGATGMAQIIELALPLALILLAESWATMRALSLRHGEDVSAPRELAALGFANIGAALLQGMPVGAGFSAGSAAEAARAASRATAVIAALTLAAVVLASRSMIAFLPMPVLAAVVIVALRHAVDPSPLLRLWKLDRDQYVALGAAAGVLVLGVLDGMLFAIALSIAALIRRMAAPPLLELGQLGGSHDFVDLERHDEAHRLPGIAIYRPAEPLFFANAERVLAAIEHRWKQDGRAAHIVVSLEESFDIDSSALDSLVEFEARIAEAGGTLWLARLHDRVRDLLKAGGAGVLAARSGFSVDDTVSKALAGA